MLVEITIYCLIALFLSSVRRVISGMKNGCFYAKGNKWETPKLIKYIKNLHFLETPAWYSQFGSVYLFYFALLRCVNYNTNPYEILIQLIASLLVTMGASAMASYHFQGYINHGSNLPWVDENENPKSEFAFGLISFWWNRPWHGKRRKYSIFGGIIMIIIGIYLGIFYRL